MEDGKHGPGLRLMSALRSAAGTLIAIVRTRVELLGVELQGLLQEGIQCLILSLITIAFAGLGVVMLSMLLLILYWDEHRVLVASALAGIFLTIAMITALALWHSMARRRNPFQASLDELGKDQQVLSDPS